MRKTLGRLAVTMTVAAVASGCAGMNFAVKPEAFGPKKAFAVVMVIASPKISYMENQPGGNRSLVGGVKALGTETGYSDDAGRIFAETFPQVLKELDASKAIALVPENKVLGSKAYSAVKGAEPKMMFTTFLMPKGYKYIKDRPTLNGLAKQLGVDGVIVLNLTYGYTMSGVNVMGLVSAGKIHAANFISISAVDRNGVWVWKDTVRGLSDNGIASVGESCNMKTLYPMLVQANKNGIREIVKKLEAALEAPKG